jgi:hypothetical protein
MAEARCSAPVTPQPGNQLEHPFRFPDATEDTELHCSDLSSLLKFLRPRWPNIRQGTTDSAVIHVITNSILAPETNIILTLHADN